jgi:hypothetical protein
VAVRFEVRFEHQEAAARALHAYSINALPSGLCVRTARRPAVGDALQVGLRIGQEAWALAAVVAWVRPEVQAVGVRFVDVGPADAARLQQVMASGSGR